jgi:alpha-beta hydrolase superfamily lysophospholipase
VTGELLDIKPSDNIEMLKEQGRDPLVIKNLMDAAYASADRYSLKTLVLYGNKDEVIPKEPVLDAFRRFPIDPADEKQLILYENGYHMLLRDLKAENVMKDIVEWLNE